MALPLASDDQKTRMLVFGDITMAMCRPIGPEAMDWDEEVPEEGSPAWPRSGLDVAAGQQQVVFAHNFQGQHLDGGT